MPTLETHRQNLERYRTLHAGIRDEKVRAMLKQLIAEAEAAIKEFGPERRDETMIV